MNKNPKSFLSKALAVALTVLMLVAASVLVVGAEGTEVATVVKVSTAEELQEALDAGATSVEFTADISGDVTITKNVTLDGAGCKYTGTMTANAALTVTVQNVNFVNGGFYKNVKSYTGNYTIKNCTFDGANKAYGYAITTVGANNVQVEDCTVKDYSYGFWYNSSSLISMKVTNVTVTNCNYGVRMGSANTTNLEGFKTVDVKYPVQIQANGARVVNLKNCSFTYEELEERSFISYWSGTSNVTSNFTGVNELGADLPTDANLKFNAAAQVGTKVYETFDAAFDAAESGDTVTLLKDYTGEAVELPKGVELDANGKAGDDKITVVLPTYVAQIGEAKFESLADAIANATAGDTIEFLADITETVTTNKAIVIDGAGFTFSGTIDANANITIKNVKFDGKGSGEYAVETRSAYEVVIQDCTAKNYFGILQVVSNGNNVTVKDVVITNVTIGLKVDHANNVVLENVDVTASSAAFLNSNYGEKPITVKNSKLNILGTWGREEAEKTFYVFEGSNTIGKFIIEADLDFFALAEVGATLTAPNDVTVTSNVEGYEAVYENGVYNVVETAKTAEINGVKYKTLQAAIKAAQNGDIVKLLEDITVTDDDIIMVGSYQIMFNVDGKNITLDLNGKTINVDYNGGQYLIAVVRVADGAGLTVTGNGKIDIAENGINVAYMFWKAGTTGYLTIENGYFHMDNSGDSMVYTNGNRIVTVNGGTFILDNVGSRVNGFPCIFNAKDNNENKIVVKGGTFNDDINHQYWCFEVEVPSNRALKNNGDDTWTVVDAVAYVGEIEGEYTHNVGYATLEEAIAAAKDGEVVTLLIALTDGLTIEKNITVVLAADKENAGTFILATEGAALVAPKGLTVKTTVSGRIVKYVDGSYVVAEPSVKNETTGAIYETLKEAIAAANAGDTIVLLDNITEDVTINKAITIDGYGFTYTGKMVLKKNITVKNVNFDGKGYDGYAIVTEGAATVTIDTCTAKNYGYGFLNIKSSNDKTFVKNVTVSDVNYGIKIDHSNGVTLENVDITASVAAIYNSNYGVKTIAIKNSKLNIIRTWTRNETVKTTYVFEGENTVGEFKTVAGLDFFKLAVGTTLTAPNTITATATEAGYSVKYEGGKYVVKADMVAIGENTYTSLAEAITAANAGDTITFLKNITEDVTINKAITIDGNGKTFTGQMVLQKNITVKNVNFDGQGYNGYAVVTKSAYIVVIEDCTVKNYAYGFLNINSNNDKTTVKNVTVSDVTYGIKVDRSNGVTLENVDITAGTAAIYNSNYGVKTIAIKNSKLNIIRTWTRNETVKTTYVFEGKNTVGEFKTNATIDNFKLAANATLAAPAELNVKTVGENDAAYVGGKYVNYVVVYKNMEFDNTLALLFAIPQNLSEIKYVKLGENFIEITDDLEKIQIGDVTYYVVKSEGFAAKQMTEIVNVRLYDADKAPLGDTLESSIKKYADSVLKDANTSDNLKKVVTDMVKYGAAAQKHFDEETDENELADSILKDKTLTAYKKYEEYESCRGVAGASGYLFTASGVRFNDSITMVFQFENIYPEGAEITFKINGQEVEGTFELTKVGVEGNVYAVEFVDLTIADAEAVITCTITKNNDVLTIKDSVASYVARRLATVEANSTAANLYTAFMNFANSAVEYAAEQQ